MFYRRWIAACTLGELVGIGVATATGLAVATWVGEPQSTGWRLAVLAAFAVVGFVEGCALGLLEWRVLRGRLPRLGAGEWTGVTVAVAVAGWILGMTPSLFASEPPVPTAEPGLGTVLALAAMVGGVAGVFFGAAQWIVLRRYADRAHLWIWIHVPAWALAMAAIFLGASLPADDWPRWLIGVSGVLGGILGGVTLGAITGIVARRLSPAIGDGRQPGRLRAAHASGFDVVGV